MMRHSSTTSPRSFDTHAATTQSAGFPVGVSVGGVASAASDLICSHPVATHVLPRRRPLTLDLRAGPRDCGRRPEDRAPRSGGLEDGVLGAHGPLVMAA